MFDNLYRPIHFVAAELPCSVPWGKPTM